MDLTNWIIVIIQVQPVRSQKNDVKLLMLMITE